jgi:hypothetical protein
MTAARDIQVDEELTVSYIDETLHYEERRARLRNWGFNCTCSLCRLDEVDRAVSDGRLNRIKSLERDLDNFRDNHVTADSGRELVELYEKERLDIYMSQPLARAAINYALFGDEEKAREFGARAAESVLVELGEMAGDLEPMRLLARDPRQHWSWGQRIIAEPSEDEDL